MFANIMARLRGLLERDAGRRRELARKQADRILSELRILKFTARTAKGALLTVRYEYPLLLTRDELWLPIDLRNRPPGISTDMFRSDAVVHSLQDRCHAAVRVETLANGKLCYVVRLAGAVYPEVFAYNSFTVPSDAPPLAIPLGIGDEGQHAVIDLEKLPHLAVAGRTGAGKTTFLHTMLATLITRNTPEDLELWLVDMKNGAELNRYAALMNKRQTGIVRRLAFEPSDALELLQMAEKEVDRRTRLFRQHDASDIRDYRRQTGQQMRYIVLVIDEVAQLMLNKERMGKYSIRQHAENLLTRIAAMARAAGVHIVFGTQMLESEVITPLIKANFEARIAFSCADDWRSRIVIDDSRAAGLPVGRMILRRDGQFTEYQSCFISPQQTRLMIRQIAKYGPDGGLGNDEGRRFLADAKLLLVTACERLNGDFSRTKLLQQDGIKGVISRERYDDIAKSLERDGILEVGRSRTPRRVARGYMNRVYLLDLVYGDQATAGAATVDSDDASEVTSTDPANSGETRGMSDNTGAVVQQDAVSDSEQLPDDAGCGMEKTGPGDLPKPVTDYLRSLDGQSSIDE